MSTADDQLQRLKVATRTHQLPEDLGQWLIDGILGWERGDFATLEEALGLRRSGKQSVPYRAALQERNTWLYVALVEFAHEAADKPYWDMGPWEHYEALAKAIRRYQSRGHATGKQPSKLHELIERANKVGIRLPGTATGIYAALRKLTHD